MRLPTVLTRSALLVMLLTLAEAQRNKFAIPDVVIQAIKPRGIVVSLPDSPGTQHFAFHGNINVPIRGKEEGSINKETSRKQNGVWQVRDNNVELKVGDVVYFWVFVQHNRLGFDKQEQKYTIAALVDDGTPPDIGTDPTTTCSPSVTTVNGKPACGGSLIFEDNFDTIDEAKWTKQYYIGGPPDNEFTTYMPQNMEASSGILALFTTLRYDVENLESLNFIPGCTGHKCEQSGKSRLLPPIIGGQIKSKFKFKYGKVTIRAQLPKGDWVYPQINLETENDQEVYNNGRIWVAFSRGNTNLQYSGREIGNKILYGGPVLSKQEPLRSSALKTQEIQGGNSWSDGFHTFTLEWRPDGMTWSVDGDSLSITNSASNFNKELLVTLGIAAGSNVNFPDGVSGKPWREKTTTSTLDYWNARTTWLQSWQNERSALKVDSIKIWSL